MVARRPVWMVGVALGACAACASPPLSVAPGPTLAPACPIAGCGASVGEPHDGGDALRTCTKADAAACAGRSPHECAEAALASWGISQDRWTLACVSRMFTEACAQEDSPACNFAGRLTLEGHGVPRDVKRGLALVEQSCDGGFVIACAAGSAWLAEGNHASEVESATEMRARLEAKLACLSGQADDCYQLGLSYYYGRESFPSDRARAAQAYERACKLGDARACNNLGDALDYGEGVERDVARAAELFARACRGGEPLACANLGYMAEHGEGVAHDVRRARDLYRAACITGEVYGCLHSAMLAAVEAGAPSDPAGALAHWQGECDRGRNAQSCAFVGLLYEDGPDGRARDEAKSDAAMSRACKLGERRACEWLKARVEE